MVVYHRGQQVFKDIWSITFHSGFTQDYFSLFNFLFVNIETGQVFTKSLATIVYDGPSVHEECGIFWLLINRPRCYE